ncbi:MAG: hypothetical protein C4320_00865, partial [Armatimonadota bacterium]
MRKNAFTLIELLVVIAIIAILAAITFPVFAQVKASGYRSNDISNLNAIRTALLLYKADQGGAPPALLGYITPYEFANTSIVPANQVFGALYPKRINSLEILRPAVNRVGPDVLVPAAWPQADERAVGTAPIVDTNGDGLVNAADDIPNARQAFSSDYSSGTINYYKKDATGIGSSTSTAGATVGRFYAISGYDVANVATPAGDVNELRYTPYWTVLGVGSGGANDDPRQLGYSEPPES